MKKVEDGEEDGSRTMAGRRESVRFPPSRKVGRSGCVCYRTWLYYDWHSDFNIQIRLAGMVYEAFVELGLGPSGGGQNGWHWVRAWAWARALLFFLAYIYP